jgi:hypothetical protein
MNKETTASDKAFLLTPKGTLTIGEEYSSPSISFYKKNEVEDVITINYTKFMYNGEEVKDLQTIYDIIKSLTTIELPSDEEEISNADSLYNKIKEIMNNDKIPVADRVTQGFKLYSNHYYPEKYNQKK